jgi:hypothetical protein
MKPVKLLLLLCLSFQPKAQPIDSTEWKNYMQHTRMYWDSLGTDYYDGIIAGNGRLGVNMYKENPKAIRFDIGRSDVTDHIILILYLHSNWFPDRDSLLAEWLFVQNQK